MGYTQIPGRTDMVLRDDGAHIPEDPGNVDWQAYLAWIAGGGVLADPPPSPSPPPPSVISDRQFFQVLAQAGAITPEEALAAVKTGALPAAIEAAVGALPEAEQFSARMLLSGATVFERGHPMVAQLGAALGYDDAALDALWTAAAAL